MGNSNSAVFFDERGIQAERIPGNVLAKAQKLIQKIERGVPYTTFRGKRLSCNRNMISIPVGRKWRMLARDSPEGIQIFAVISHATYNHII
ncbi:MAG: hypothetical protein L6461_21695 [Anaerolineae bacterium]|nr:hypothetical protein [Anaerolineae bacterium]